MKKWLVAMSLVSLSSLAHAEGGVFLGLSMQLGGNISARDIGVTAKVVSSNREDRAVLVGSKIDQWTPRINFRTRGERASRTSPAMSA